MADILNSANLHSAFLVFPPKISITFQDWFPLFAQKKLHLFILTQLDNGSYLEFCCLGFSHFAQQNFTHSFRLNLMMAAILNSTNLNSTILDSDHLRFSSQTHSHLPRLVPNICTKKLHSIILTQLDDCSYLEICHLGFSHLAKKELHSFILTQLDDGSHLVFYHLGFSHFAKKELHSFILT